jgi:hypothetical protein
MFRFIPTCFGTPFRVHISHPSGPCPYLGYELGFWVPVKICGTLSTPYMELDVLYI